MGMYYSIKANIETSCKDDFPESLSYFFEAIGGWGEESEVAQVSKILDIDLSTFQDYYFYDMSETEEEATWKDLNAFQALIQLFIQKIDSNPDYFKEVIYNPKRTKLDSLNSNLHEKLKDQKTIQEQLKEIQLLDQKIQEETEDEFYLYPADRKYLSNNQLKRDLQVLNSILDCYKKKGATKIQLGYN